MRAYAVPEHCVWVFRIPPLQDGPDFKATLICRGLWLMSPSATVLGRSCHQMRLPMSKASRSMQSSPSVSGRGRICGDPVTGRLVDRAVEEFVNIAVIDHQVAHDRVVIENGASG